MKRVALFFVVAALSVASRRASADEAGDVAKAVATDLAGGKIRDAIEACEAFADAGGRSADVSYDRGVAYLARIRAGQEAPGDLGRAAAAFEETLLLRPNDEDAMRALEIVRSEVARRRARGGADVDIASNPSALRAVVGLLPETQWGIVAAIGSVCLTLGLAFRTAVSRPIRLTSGIAVSFGAFLLVVFGSLAAAAREVRRSTATGVIVVPEARLLDSRGVPKNEPPVPEAAKVDVLDRAGTLVHVRWGTRDGYTAATNVRVVRAAGEP